MRYELSNEADMMEEQWCDVVGYEGLYQVSDAGRIRSLPRESVCLNKRGTRFTCRHDGRMMKSVSVNPSGHQKVVLAKNGKYKQRLVHRLMFEAFNGWCPKILNHKDNDPTNNRIENIEASDSVHNARHAIDNGFWKDKGMDNPRSKLNDDAVISIRDQRKNGHTLRSLANKHGVSEASISLICNRKSWQHI